MRRFISMRTLCAAAIAALLTSNLFLASCNGDEDYEMNGEYTLAEGRMTRSPEGGAQPLSPVPLTNYYTAGDTTVCVGLVDNHVLQFKVSWNDGYAYEQYMHVASSISNPDSTTSNSNLNITNIQLFAEGLQFSYYGVVNINNEEYTIWDVIVVPIRTSNPPTTQDTNLNNDRKTKEIDSYTWFWDHGIEYIQIVFTDGTTCTLTSEEFEARKQSGTL